MGFWETMLAAAAGSLIAIGAAFAVKALYFAAWSKRTALGRFHTKTADDIEDALRKAEQRR